jgi:hypothetical protein
MSSNDRNENPDNHDQEGTAKNSFFEKKADKTQDREANTGTEHEQKKSCEWPQNPLTVDIGKVEDKWTIGNKISFTTCMISLAYFVSTIVIYFVYKDILENTGKGWFGRRKVKN